MHECEHAVVRRAVMAAASPSHKRKATSVVVSDDGSDAASEYDFCDPSPAKSKKARYQTGSVTDYAASAAPSFALTNSPTLGGTDTPATEASTTRRRGKVRPKKFGCGWPGCTKAFDRPVRLQAHYNTHTGERPYACPQAGCDKAFFKPTHLKAHISEKHTEDRSHVCTFLVLNESGEAIECGRAFPTSTKLKRHVAQHEEKEETTCSWEGCGKVFRKQETLQRHVKKDHLHEQPYLCTHSTSDGGACGQSFATPGLLKTHIGREHSAQRYVCEICSGESRPLQSDMIDTGNDLDAAFLPQAVDGVQGSEDFAAGVFSLDPTQELQPAGMMVFASFADLQFHNRMVHPPTCTECGKQCKSNKDLKAHIDIYHAPPATEHKDPGKEFLCPVHDCPRAQPGCGFTRKGNMDVHIKNVHAKEKAFVCGAFDLSDNDKVRGWDGTGCRHALSTKQALIAHVRTQHLGLDAATGVHTGLQKDAHSKKGRPRKEAAPDAEIVMEHPPAPSAALALLTGAGYEELRPIPCLLQDCQMRFVREYDLATHLELTHGWQVDDVTEALACGAVALAQAGRAMHAPSQQVTSSPFDAHQEMADLQTIHGVLDPQLQSVFA